MSIFFSFIESFHFWCYNPKISGALFTQMLLNTHSTVERSYSRQVTLTIRRNSWSTSKCRKIFAKELNQSQKRAENAFAVLLLPIWILFRSSLFASLPDPRPCCYGTLMCCCYYYYYSWYYRCRCVMKWELLALLFGVACLTSKCVSRFSSPALFVHSLRCLSRSHFPCHTNALRTLMQSLACTFQ